MAKESVEEIKRKSVGLRGEIVETIVSGASHFEDAEYQLLKFHGSYQQDDRDLRSERRKAKLDKAWSMMVRSKMPGGRMTAKQYLMHDEMIDRIGNGTMRLTTRQGIQLHGILIGDLKEVIDTICKSGLTTYGACGDVVRNTMAPAAPVDSVAYRDAHDLASEITELTLPKSSGYADIWLDGEKLEPVNKDELEVEEDEMYGKDYLPRKFKIGIAIPPNNDVDVYTHDLGLVPQLSEDGSQVEGYTFLVGGGFGMGHGKTETRPVLAKPLAYVPRAHVIEVLKAVIQVQKEYGNRKDRRMARLKYVIETFGIAWFLNAVKERYDGPLQDPKEFSFDSVSDHLGWHEQGDAEGLLFRGVYVAQGRIHDTEKVRVRTAFREIAEKYELPMIVTPNTNLILHDIKPEKKDEIEALLKEHGFADESGFTDMRKVAHACVSMPTCGLALAEAERVLDGLLDSVDEILRDLGLDDDQLLIRMTGCPNGCARPYNADIAFVGRGPRKYAMYVGGSSSGDRLAGLYQKTIEFDDIAPKIRVILQDFADNREDDERFTEYWERTQATGEAPGPDHFHVELAERAKRVKGGSI
ncbi:MAG: NADPH-dependent assimilatory sulfite reductase hemoprotein subunit [Verrucomicrobiota bacterium]